MRAVLISLLLAIAFCNVPLSALHASTRYVCPDINDENKQTLSPMIQGKDGWFFRLEGDLKSGFKLYDESLRYMQRLVEALKARGTQLVFISVPAKGMVARGYLPADEALAFDATAASASYKRYLQKLASTGAIVPDLLAGIDAEAMTAENFFFLRDHHWNTSGANIAAKLVAQAVQRSPAYNNITPTAFKTVQDGTQFMKHTMALELQRLCQTEMPAEEYPRYATTLDASNASGEQALFGDVGSDDPPSVLLGSSFSAEQEFNFDGFLSQHTGLVINNRAITGGLLYNSLISYVSDEAFHAQQPPFLFWEAPAVYNMNYNAAGFFRQILPAIHGECSGDQKIAEGRVTIRAGKPDATLLTLDATKEVYGNEYYLMLTTDNYALTKFTLKTDYDDGDGEWFDVDRSEFFDQHGRFFVELSDDITSNLTSISLDQISNVNATMRAILCKAPASATIQATH